MMEEEQYKEEFLNTADQFNKAKELSETQKAQQLLLSST
jgi:hypothetical protein